MRISILTGWTSTILLHHYMGMGSGTVGSAEFNSQELKSKRQRLRRVKNNASLIYIVGAVMLLATVAFLFIKGSHGSVYAVKVQDQVIGYTDDETLLDNILERFAEEESHRVGAEVVLDTQVSLEKVKATKDTEITDEDTLASSLKERVNFKSRGWVISVNGEDVIALCDEEDARGVIQDLRESYIQSILQKASSNVEEVYINEQVDVVEKEFPSELFRTREEAGKILLRGTDKTLNYTVQRGDSLWSIAQAHKLTVNDLKNANPQVSGDLIREGETLDLVVPDPYVTLSSRETVVFTQSIPFTVEVSYDDTMWPWQETVTQAGKNGSKEITQEVVRENGKEVSRVTVKEEILSYPVKKKVVRGSKQVPAMGSGEMAWPVEGSITSYYGWRWGSMHQGVDIGAPSGTPVIAADSGMVSFAGWNGGYGNLVKIDHGNGKETWYAHLSKFAVSVGAKVEKGQVIGYVGSTGRSNGPHLHFEVRQGGSAKDPLSYYK